MARHPENVAVPGVIAFRPEASLVYINADAVSEAVLARLGDCGEIVLVVCDLSASPNIDLAGSRMLHDLYNELRSRDIPLRIVGAHGNVRDLLRADGLAEKTGGLDRATTLHSLLGNADRIPSPVSLKRRGASEWDAIGTDTETDATFGCGAAYVGVGARIIKAVHIC